jgi:hypothetical protein
MVAWMVILLMLLCAVPIFLLTLIGLWAFEEIQK